MVCEDVGDTNADIAGLGIILSFTIQGGISYILSVWYACLDLKSQYIRSQWYIQQWVDRETPSIGDVNQRRELVMILISGILKTVSDTQLLSGISLLIGAFVQRNTLSLYHYHIIYDSVNFTGISAAAAAMVIFQSPNTIAHTLYLVSLYISLYLVYVILFLVKLSSWDDNIRGLCYHAEGITSSSSGRIHPTNDIAYIALTALYLSASLTTCLVPASRSLQRLLKKIEVTTLRGAIIVEGLYIMLSIIRGGFFLAINRWIRIVSGVPLMGRFNSPELLRLWYSFWEIFHPRFYERLARKAEAKGDLHFLLFTRVLRDYVRLLWLIGLLYHWLGSTGLSVLFIAIAQYPLHAYMLFQLRQANQPFLSGDPESFWGFGQVVALVLVAATILDCIRSSFSFVILVHSRDDQNRSEEWEKIMSLLRKLFVDDSIQWPTTTRPEPSAEAASLAASQGGEDTTIRVERRYSV